MEVQDHPLLLPKLQTAISCLYGKNDSSQLLQTPQNRSEAHDFLLRFKASNIRRSVVSRIQSQRDRVGGNGDHNHGHAIAAEGDEGEDRDGGAGSIFLSALALILQPRSSISSNSSSGLDDGHRIHERIFAAQTLNHRCRSIKIVETLDIEAEDGVECGVARLVLAWEEMRRARLSCSAASNGINPAEQGNALKEKSKAILTAWLERYVPMIVHRCGGNRGSSNASNLGTFCVGAELLELVLQRHASSLLNDANSDDSGDEKGEEQIKGALIILTLAVSMYVSAFADFEEEHQYHHGQTQQNNQARSPWANAVLSDLGSALSITAVRVRYRSTKDKNATPSPEPSCPPLINMLVNAMGVVRESAEVYFSQKLQQQHQQNDDAQTAVLQAHKHAIKRSIAACIKALPETALLPPGQEDGGHRIPSVDRACLRAASMELRSVGSNHEDVGTGMDMAWKVVLESEHGDVNLDRDASASRLLECCEAWARYVAVPIYVVEVTVGSLAIEYLHVVRASSDSPQHQRAQAAAFQYLVSIFESASPSLTTGDILTAALGVGAGGHRGKGGGASSSKKSVNTKKKQGNKSKKRHEKRLGRAIAVQDDSEEGGSVDAAERELLARRNSACVAAATAFGVSLSDASTVGSDWGLRPSASSLSTSTHGVCSTVASAAASVLPHLLFLERGDDENNGGSGQKMWRLELFSAITMVIRRLCASLSRDMRSLAYEPIMILHTSLNLASAVSLRMEQVAMDAIGECALALATSCGYPPGYFDCLAENNDEELEIERNDVRDVARSVCSLDSVDLIPELKSPSILVLERLVSACNTAIRDSALSGNLPPETVVHILSALAKPLNKLGRQYKSQPSAFGCAIMTASMLALGYVCEQLNSSFDSRPMSQILPLSRLALMGMASLSPMLSALSEVMKRAPTSNAEQEMFLALKRTCLASLQHSILSTASIPELVAESTLESTRYDIKGAMRGPGGEDHVGCIALLRLSHESDYLTCTIFEVYGSTILLDLSNLYQGLKTSELERGVGCDYGRGVCPVSRRMIMRVISHLALYEMKGAKDQASEGQAILQQLLQQPLGVLGPQRDAPLSAEKIYRVCESAYDLSFFSPELVTDLFNNPPDDLGVICDCVIAGYSRLSFTSDVDDVYQQWGRLRGGAYSMLCTSMKVAITDYSAHNISALVKAECEAATLQCNQGPESGSNIFNDSVVGEDRVHAGIYLVLIRNCLDRIIKKKHQEQKSIQECQKCLSVLKSLGSSITPLLLHQSPEATSHVDPRPTIAEAWFLTIKSLVSICQSHEQIASSLVGDGVEVFLGESMSIAMALILLKDLGTKKTPSPDIQKGMSLDGPHTLAILSFISESMLLGPSILSAGGTSILSASQVIDTYGQSNIGAAILTSTLLRSVSGALAPWAVEEMPTLFRSLYMVVGGDSDAFVQVLSVSTKLKASVPCGGVRAGELIAGRYLDVSDSHVKAFLSQSKEVCNKGNWKKLKVILKATCGGKKKDSGFNLKPHLTSWECERL